MQETDCRLAPTRPRFRMPPSLAAHCAHHSPVVRTVNGVVVPLGLRMKEDPMSEQRTDAEELTLAVAALERAVDRIAKLVGSDDHSTRDHARYQLRRLERTWLCCVINHANKSKEPCRCVRYLEALGELGQWDAEVVLKGIRRLLARLDASTERDAAVRAVRPLVEAVKEGRGSRQKRVDR